jgi:protein TonB
MATMQASMQPRRAAVSSRDRLGLTLFIAVVLHTLVILGVTFDVERAKPPQKLPGLEVTLVQTKSEKPIKDADFLAQASQEGGGDSQEKQRPTVPDVPVVPDEKVAEVVQEVVPETQTPTSPEPPQRDILTVTRSQEKVAAGVEVPQAQPETRITAAQLLSQSREMASLAAEIDQTQRAFARLPKRTYITARTQEYRFASYEEAWRLKVERVGKLNFPDEARRQQLSGSLIMSVTIAADGSITDIDIRKPSEHKVLDDAAMRIVRLAAPFAPFGQDIRQDTDELVITRTWIFEAGSGFTAH